MSVEQELNTSELRTKIKSDLVDADQASFLNQVVDDTEGLEDKLEVSSLARVRRVAGLMGIIHARNEGFFTPSDPTPKN